MRKRKIHSLSSSIRAKKRLDFILVLFVGILCCFGLLMVYEASAVSAFRDFGDRFHYIREQARWLGLGFIAMVITSFFPYKKLYGLALPLLLGTMVLLFAVFLPGIGVHALGARRWLNFGFFVLQPSELAKLTLVIYLSAWFSYPARHRLGSFLLLMGMMIGLIFLQPDLGTAILVLAIAMILYFVSGAPISHAFYLLPLAACGVFLISLLAPYRFKRLTTFINPQTDPLGASYHIRQIIISLGSGGLFGVGLGNSLQKYEYLPEATTDSIFAIIGEELGFAGSVALIFLFCLFLLRGLRIASNAPDKFGRLLAIGITSWVGVQAGINISAMAALLPLTGIPLPFISYGGSSLILLLTAIGILLNISRSR